jgi:predicted dehydrogenase
MSKVRVAILGCGGMAGAHANRFKGNPQVEIVALCDVSEAVVNSFIDRNLKDYAARPAIFTDAATMYAKAKPDAVCIVTPHTLHFEHGMQALAAGLHVLMEKPMVTSSEQAHKLAKAAKDSGKIFVIGYNTPCTPEFAYLRDRIRDKTFGKLELVSGYLSQDWKRLTMGSWRQKPELSGGGQAYDSGAHILNSLTWSVEQDIEEVFAFVDNHGTAVDVNSSINIRFANGTFASIVVSGNCPANGSSLHFVFEKGRVDIDGWGGGWINVFTNDKVKYPVIPGNAQSPNDNFIEAIQGKADPRTTPRNGIVQSELMDAIYESAKTGKPARPKRGAKAST